MQLLKKPIEEDACVLAHDTSPRQYGSMSRIVGESAVWLS